MYDPRGRLLSFLFSGTDAVNDLLLHTFEITHSTLTEPLRLCTGGLDSTVRIGTENVDFKARSIRFALGSVVPSSAGNLSVTLDNAAGDLTKVFTPLTESTESAMLTYRLYRTTSPLRLSADEISLEVSYCTINNTDITINATIVYVANLTIPDVTFNEYLFPNLSRKR